jgi:ketosteroid isomerase-like protein
METIKNLIKQIVLLFLPTEQKEVVAVLESYAAAFLTFKPANVIDYFDQPLTLLLDTGPEAMDTTEQVTEYLQGYMKNLQDEHYQTDVLTRMRLKTITKTVVVTSFHLVRVNTSGQPFNSMNAMYTWRKTDGQWRVIIGVLLSDGNIPPVPASAPARA